VRGSIISLERRRTSEHREYRDDRFKPFRVLGSQDICTGRTVLGPSSTLCTMNGTISAYDSRLFRNIFTSDRMRAEFST